MTKRDCPYGEHSIEVGSEKINNGVQGIAHGKGR